MAQANDHRQIGAPVVPSDVMTSIESTAAPVVIAVGLDATAFDAVAPVVSAHGTRLEVALEVDAVPRAIDDAPAAIVLAGELRTAKAIKELLPDATVAVISDDLGRRAEEAAFAAHVRPLAALDAGAVERFLAVHLPAPHPAVEAVGRRGIWHRRRPAAAASADGRQ